MTRLYLPQALAEGQHLELPAAAARHVVQVLRLRAGAALTLFNGEGGEFQCVLASMDKHAATVQVGTYQPVERESPLQLTLAQCVAKGERMDYSIQKAVELGVHRIVPLLSARSVVKLGAERWDKKRQHWEGVIAAACEQCGRNRLPRLAPVSALSEWLSHGKDKGHDHDVRLVLAPDAQTSLAAFPAARAASLLIGPEGGLSEAEIASAVSQGCTAVSLGPRVLRTETAGVAALAALQSLWGDFRI